MRFSLVTGITQSNTPFTLGYAFKRGDVPAGKTVIAQGLTIQVTPKNRWPDGSLKFAVISGRVALQAGVSATFALVPVDAPVTAPAPISTAQLRSTGLRAEFSAGALGSSLFSGADWDSPVTAWIAGSEMSSWVYRKPFSMAGVPDAHLVCWIEVRLYADNRVEVLPWIENGYLRVANPTNKAATYSFTLNGKREFSAFIDLKHHQRTVLISGEATSYGVPFDSGVIAHHDTQYLQSTELVPSYRPRLAASSAALARLSRSFTPLSAHGLIYENDDMSGPGYQSPIGLLPEQDVAYLISDATATWSGVLRNGYAVGRYGIHYRDELTQRALRFSDHPTYTIRGDQGFNGSGGGTNFTPAATGGNPPLWDVSHSPSVGYLAYIISGWRYFCEEAQFAATANFLGKDKGLRGGTLGLVRTFVQAWQTRACAWQWRALVQALCITPDDDPIRPEFVASVEANIKNLHDMYVAQPNNPWGWVKPGEDAYDGTIRLGAPWQQDFVTAAFGYSNALGLPISADATTKLDAFFQWKARSVVMRLGNSQQFWYINAAPYTMVISPSKAPNYDDGTGPWYATERQVYDATYAVPPPTPGTTEGTLSATFPPHERSYWGNLQPAIAYAVRFGVPGALEGYNRMTSATNWPAAREAFNSHPVWSVIPSRIEPAWLAGKNANTWIQIPGTSGALGAVVNAFSGMALDERTSEIIIASAGGHTDSDDNRVVSLRLTSDAPQWILRKAPSAITRENVSHYPDGTPTSRHLYHHIHVVERLDRVFHFGCRAAYGGPAFEYTDVDAFNLSTNQWEPRGTWPAIPRDQGFGAVRIPDSGDVWTTALARWSAATNTWSTPITQSQGGGFIRWPMAYDSRRRQIFCLLWGDGQSYDGPSVSAVRVPIDGNTRFRVTLQAGTALTQFLAEGPAYAGMDYDPINDCFVFYSGIGQAAGRLYVVKPNETNNWAISILPLASGSPIPTPVLQSGVYSRFRYVPALRGFVMYPRRESNIFFIRVSI